MPICKKCRKKFPNRIKIDGKLRVLSSRKYCLECSPFGIHNTSKIHLSNLEKGQLFKNKTKIIICSLCNREYIYETNNKKGHTLTRCNSCAINERRFKIKKKAIDYKGGKCQICEYDKDVQPVYEFHHLNPNTKEFSLSGSHCYSWTRIEKELDKCVCLCCRCHREYHAGLISL